MRHPDWSEEELVRRLQQRDSDALETLVSRYEHDLSHWIRIVLDGVGEDQAGCASMPQRSVCGGLARD